ncbi:hypothetical protein WA158_001182 [Blastocystis sp. Blastoise]
MLGRKKLLSYCAKLLFMDPDFFLEHGVLQLLWKECFHTFIERFRKLVSEDETVRSEYNEFIQESIKTMKDIYDRIEKEECIEDHMSENTYRFSRNIKQKCLYNMNIYLGDLERYLELNNTREDKNWNQAEYYYKQACALDPNNGNPRNQLAILATYRQIKGIIIYQYIRALAAPLPFSTARRNLIVQFQKNNHDYEEYLQERKEYLEVGKNEPMRRRTALKNCLTLFTKLQSVLFLGDTDIKLEALLNTTLIEFKCLLKEDLCSTPFLFRLVAVSLFYTIDLKTYKMNSFLATELNATCLYGWIILFRITTLCLRYTAHSVNTHTTNGISSSDLRPLPAICIFMKWFNKQYADHFRPKFFPTLLSTSTSYITNTISLPIDTYLTAEEDLYKEMYYLANRLTAEDNNPQEYTYPYELELKGYIPTNDVFHYPVYLSTIPPSAPLSSYIKIYHEEFSKLMADPRIPIAGGKLEQFKDSRHPSIDLVDPNDSSPHNAFMYYYTHQYSKDAEDEDPSFPSITAYNQVNYKESPEQVYSSTSKPSHPGHQRFASHSSTYSKDTVSSPQYIMYNDRPSLYTPTNIISPITQDNSYTSRSYSLSYVSANSPSTDSSPAHGSYPYSPYLYRNSSNTPH